MSTFEPRRGYHGWSRCLVDVVAFDTFPELEAARVLDASSDVRWWMRNDPVLFRIDTPVGGFEPDFIYERGQSAIRGLLEIKGDFLWDGPNSREQLKARAACSWVEAANSVRDTSIWEFALVIAEDLSAAAHIDALRHIARSREP